MNLSNIEQLTVNQEDKLHRLVTEIFEKNVTTDFWHFSFEGTRLNLKSLNTECVFEVHSSKGSFNVFIDLTENKKGLKSTLQIIKLK